MPLPPQLLARLPNVLVSRAGGYLRNPIREDRVTCAICTTPVDGYPQCFRCSSQLRTNPLLADAVAPLVYGVAGAQSGFVMRGYKAHPPVQEHRSIVAMTAMLGIGKHSTCTERLGGAAITHWSTVPSLPAKPGVHPLRQLIAPATTGKELVLTPAASPKDPRAVDGSHFTTDPLPTSSHVLLIEDTWVGGGHAQSAVLSLRRAGAARVSVMAVARWVDLNYGSNEQFFKQRVTRDYDPEICPWTGDACP